MACARPGGQPAPDVADSTAALTTGTAASGAGSSAPASPAPNTPAGSRAPADPSGSPSSVGASDAPVALTNPSPTGTAIVPATVTLTPHPPWPTATELPFRITGALAIDGPRGKVYAPVRAAGVDDIGIFDALDGRELGRLGLKGSVAVDEARARVLVDEIGVGLHVLDAVTGEELRRVAVPSATPAPRQTSASQPGVEVKPFAEWPASPAVDASDGTVIVLRRQVLWVVEEGKPMARAVRVHGPISGTVPLSLPDWAAHPFATDGGFRSVVAFGRGRSLAVAMGCLEAFGFPGESMNWLRYDHANEVEASCNEIEGFGTEPLAAAGTRLAVAVHRYKGPVSWRLYRDGRPRAELFGAPDTAFVWLPGQNRFLAQVDTPAGGLLLLDPDDLTPRQALPARPEGHLAGYDPMSDTLYFVDDSRMVALPYSEAQAEPTLPSPQTRLLRSPSGDVLRALPARGGLARHLDGARPFVCRVSPNFSVDTTAVCASPGRGVFRTEDGGRSYQTAMGRLPSWAVDDLQVSTAFPRDRTLFLTMDLEDVQASWGFLKSIFYHSHDAGDTWIPSGDVTAVAQSPDPAQAATLYAFGSWACGGTCEPGRAYRSTDRGATWQLVGALPDGSGVRRLYSFPSQDGGRPILIAIGGKVQEGFNVWHINDNKVFRSTDGARTWTVVMAKNGEDGDSRRASLLSVPSAVAGTALLIDGWEVGSVNGVAPTPPPLSTGERPLPTTLRSYDLGATWHYVRLDGAPRPLAVDLEGKPIGFDVDAKAVAIYTLPTAEPTATPPR